MYSKCNTVTVLPHERSTTGRLNLNDTLWKLQHTIKFNRTKSMTRRFILEHMLEMTIVHFTLTGSIHCNCAFSALKWLETFSVQASLIQKEHKERDSNFSCRRDRTRCICRISPPCFVLRFLYTSYWRSVLPVCQHHKVSPTAKCVWFKQNAGQQLLLGNKVLSAYFSCCIIVTFSS